MVEMVVLLRNIMLIGAIVTSVAVCGITYGVNKMIERKNEKHD